jgi:hypothetical protein
LTGVLAPDVKKNKKEETKKSTKKASDIAPISDRKFETKDWQEAKITDQVFSEEGLLYDFFNKKKFSISHPPMGDFSQSDHQIAFDCPLFSASVQIDKTRILVIGGGFGGTTKVSEINTDSGVVSDLSPMLVKRQYHAVTRYGQKVYALAGYNTDEDDLNSCEVLDTKTGEWEHIDSVHQRKVQSSAVAMTNGAIYLFGGTFRGQRLDAIERYVIWNDTWTMMAVKLKVPLDSMLCHAIAHDKILICGGCDGDTESQDVYKFDIGDNTVSESVQMEHKRASLRSRSYLHQGQVYLYGIQGDAEIFNFENMGSQNLKGPRFMWSKTICLK